MTTLTRWDPRQELVNLRSEIDRFMSDPFFNMPVQWSRELPNMRLALDVAETDDAFVVKDERASLQEGA